jgi:chemotaxis protein MotC
MSLRSTLILAALLSTAPAAAQTGTVRISDMADELQRIQTRIANGDGSAYPAQLAQLKAIRAAIAAAKPDTWQDKREADSLVVYVLSGGSVAQVANLIKTGALIESERPLALGAVAYITGHEAEALRLLSTIDLDELDGRVAGQIAFARSVLETKRDPKAAVSQLDWARLLAPGGLVEEAALRRETAILAEAGDASRAATLAGSYATRFGASLYEADFFRELARLAGRTGLLEDPADYELFSRATLALSAEGRLDFLLTLARAAIVNGRFKTASAAATDALRGAPMNRRNEARARLYLNAAQMFSDGHEAALANLQGLSSSTLDRSDAALLAAFRAAAAQFRLAPNPSAVEAQADSAGDVKAGGAALTIRDALAALERTESLVSSERDVK